MMILMTIIINANQSNTILFYRKIWLFSQVLGFANSAWNPFIYCIFSKQFREGFKAVFFWRKSKHANIKSHSSGDNVKYHQSRTRSTTDTSYGTSISADAYTIRQEHIELGGCCRTSPSASDKRNDTKPPRGRLQIEDIDSGIGAV